MHDSSNTKEPAARAMNALHSRKKTGVVYLVGAGPGDPKLITARGIECLARADVVVYDRLANNRLLQYAAESAKLIDVGKQAGKHTEPQSRINRIIASEARKGSTVVRLKGGDPFVFGRGGEEALHLRRNNIPFEVVHGVSSAFSVPGAAGIPPTHRGLASMVTVVTGHGRDGADRSDLNWAWLAKHPGTLVFLMGVARAKTICAELVAKGMPPRTRAALIEMGTTAKQRTVTASLLNLAAKARETGIAPPAVLVIGRVVRLRDKLNWFENRPLFGRTVLVTRAREQAGELSGRLEELGAEVVEFPVIRMTGPANWSRLDSAIRRLAGYDWIIFTSVNGVESFFARLAKYGKDARALGGLKACAIGPATAERLKSFGILVDFQPREYVSERIAEGLAAVESLRGKRILLPRAADARPALPQMLRRAGATVTEVVAYRALPIADGDALAQALARRPVDVVALASSATVRSLVDALGDCRARRLLRSAAAACIGPITRATAEDAGLNCAISPRKYTIPALVDAIVEWSRRIRLQKKEKVPQAFRPVGQNRVLRV